MMIANERTVIAKLTYRLCKHSVVRYTHAGFAIGPQVFTEIETETADISNTADSLSLVGCAMSLRSVFDHTQMMRTRKVEHRLHIYGMAVQMNRDNSTRPGSQHLFK